MKPQYYRDSETPQAAGSNALESRSTRDLGMHAVNARPPPAVPYRRYPTLSDDGQPYFPRLRRRPRNADENVTNVSSNEEAGSPFFSVRVFAILALIAIIAVLVANA